jgi:hypothetical protein
LLYANVTLQLVQDHNDTNLREIKHLVWFSIHWQECIHGLNSLFVAGSHSLQALNKGETSAVERPRNICVEDALNGTDSARSQRQLVALLWQRSGHCNSELENTFAELQPGLLKGDLRIGIMATINVDIAPPCVRKDVVDLDECI